MTLTEIQEVVTTIIHYFTTINLICDVALKIKPTEQIYKHTVPGKEKLSSNNPDTYLGAPSSLSRTP